MSHMIQVTNFEPQTTTDVAEPLLSLFQQYTQVEFGQSFNPFTHQAEVFKVVGEYEKAAMLIAGTAAGKTLAIGIPLFHKLLTKRIKRILLMYPTIALMNDQRRVMDRLGSLTGQSVGLIKGGIPRSALIAQLNKPVIVATPDAIYWFFQKNVKYSGLLIYGLSLVDEVVLDEAHLFNGLTLRNISHLKQRMMSLAERLGRRQRWHVLTATPTTQLQELAKDAEIVTGHSKCGPVQAVFLLPSQKEDEETVLTQTVTEALQSGADKVLLVLNSAAAAHRLFEQVRGKQPQLPANLLRRFGTVSWGDLQQWLTTESIDPGVVTAIAAWVEQEGPYYLADLQTGTQADIHTESLIATAGKFLQYLSRQVKNTVYAVAQQTPNSSFIKNIEQQLRQQSKAVSELWQMIRTDLGDDETTPETVKQVLNNHLNGVSEKLESIWANEILLVTAPDFPELTNGLTQAGLPPTIANLLSRRLKHSTELDENAARSIQKSQSVLNKRHVALRWLGERWLVQDEEVRRDLRVRLETALQQNWLQVETRHIATWGETDIPAVIYSGQMSARDREGLIEVFDKELDRAVLVSTPAVEVGVDFKAGVMITEECDGNAFLQRFGRVGRTGQGEAEVFILLKEGQTWTRLQQRGQPQMSREAFSQMIIDPQNPTDPQYSLLPDRTYSATSIYQDATHWLINRQLGRVGQTFNQTMFPDTTVADLGQQMANADVTFAYGLRGTMPGVSLLGGGGGSPFYVFSKVPDDKLVASNSPFEVAQAKMGYTAFLYAKRRWEIVVDWKKTLAAGQVMYYWLDGHWQMVTGYSITGSYLDGYWLLRRCRNDWDLMQHKLTDPHPRAQAIVRMGDSLKLLTTPQANFILGQGDVFLKRREDELDVGLVKDYLETPLVLSNQLWLYIIGDAETIRRQLGQASLDQLSEVHYPPAAEDNILLLDQVAGGCFYIYERLVRNAA